MSAEKTTQATPIASTSRDNMKIISVVGARPNFMKIGPIAKAIAEHNRVVGAAGKSGKIIQHVLVHTGQHYDKAMSDQFFEDLQLPQPDIFLGVGSASHAVQTAEIMRKFEEVLLKEKPHAVIVVGDVNSTVACALVTAKISFDGEGARPLVLHVESGLRSFDRGMPEEVNRVLTDHISDMLFVTEESGLQNLAKEGIAPDKIHFVGNTMIDSLLAYQDKADRSPILQSLGLRESEVASPTPAVSQKYALLTLHRPSNVDTREGLLKILEGLSGLVSEYPIIFSAHPRTQKRIQEFGLADRFSRIPTAGSNSSNGASPRLIANSAIAMTDPLGYIDFLCLMKNASLVVTDSGGIQEETTCLGIPCVTVRENTERPVTVTGGTNYIAGTTVEGIRAAIQNRLQEKPAKRIPPKWDGQAAKRIVQIITGA
jgi:UDP-N-acetylglucosamine 2-epimerase (non-hydrolysing)